MKTAALVLAALALVVSSCGGGGGDDEAAEQPPAETAAPAETAEPEPPAETEMGADVSGEAVFAANCGNCHTLAAAGTSGQVGPNLDDRAPSVEETAEQVRNGGGGMPAFEGQLSDAEIQAVAEYVAQNAGG